MASSALPCAVLHFVNFTRFLVAGASSPAKSFRSGAKSFRSPLRPRRMPLRQRNGEPVSRHGRSRPQSVADQRRWHQRAPPLVKTPLPTASPHHCCAVVACLPAWTDAPVCADATRRRARAAAARFEPRTRHSLRRAALHLSSFPAWSWQGGRFKQKGKQQSKLRGDKPTTDWREWLWRRDHSDLDRIR